MKYSIENKGTGVVMIRVFVPENLTMKFLTFIESQERSTNQIPSTKKPSPLRDENYFIQLNSKCLSLFDFCIADGLSVKAALSATLKKLKGTDFFNISYDALKSILTKQGCFRTKTL